MPATRIWDGTVWQDLAVAGPPGVNGVDGVGARFPSFSAYRSASGSYALATTILFDTELWDTDSWYNPANGRFTPKIPGKYRLSWSVRPNVVLTAGKYWIATLLKNGVAACTGSIGYQPSGATQPTGSGNTALVDANGTTDYFEIAIFHDMGSATAISNQVVGSWFAGELVEPSGGPVQLPTAALVSALPSSPVDGQECFYQNAAMATAGIVWRLRYRSGGGTYKWEFVGGPSLVSYVTSAQNKTLASGTYVIEDFGTGSPTIVVPLTGFYEIAISADMWCQAPQVAPFEYLIIATNAANTMLMTMGFYAHAAAVNHLVGFGSYSKRGPAGMDTPVALTAGETLKFRHYGNSAGSTAMRSRERSMVLTPIRVG